MPTVVLVGTLDTKGREYEFLRDRVREHGVDVLLIDAGIVGEPLAVPDVTREEVAATVAADVQALAEAGDRGAAVETMSRGAAEVLKRLHAEGRCDGVLGLGEDPYERRRRDRRHGEGDGAAAPRRQAARRRDDVRRHDAVRDEGA